MFTQDKRTKLSEPVTYIFRDRVGVVLIKSLNQVKVYHKGKPNTKHQYNVKYLSRFNDKNAFRKLKKNLYIFPDLGCMHRRMCVNACHIPGRRNI